MDKSKWMHTPRKRQTRIRALSFHPSNESLFLLAVYSFLFLFFARWFLALAPHKSDFLHCSFVLSPSLPIFISFFHTIKQLLLLNVFVLCRHTQNRDVPAFPFPQVVRKKNRQIALWKLRYILYKLHYNNNVRPYYTTYRKFCQYTSVNKYCIILSFLFHLLRYFLFYVHQF